MAKRLKIIERLDKHDAIKYRTESVIYTLMTLVTFCLTIACLLSKVHALACGSLILTLVFITLSIDSYNMARFNLIDDKLDELMKKRR